METENEISAMIKLRKEKGNYKNGDELTIVVSNPDFNHDISIVVKSDVEARHFINHVCRILSSNENLNVTQTIFNIKVVNLSRGRGKSKTIKNNLKKFCVS